MEKLGTAGQDTEHDIRRRMRFDCGIPKATNTHSQHVIFIAFPLQQWLQWRASKLHYTYTACPVPHNCNERLSRLQGSRELACISHDEHTRRRLRQHFWQHTDERHFQQKYTKCCPPDVPKLVTHYLTHF